jgi:ATP-dependent protease HslVU (ClpYQ) peptidase subunit
VTVIAAARTKKDGIVIAGDSEISWGDYMKDNAGTKLALLGTDTGWVAGFCGGARDAQVFQYHVDWPPNFTDVGYNGNLEAFVIQIIVPQLMEAADAHSIMWGGSDVGEPKSVESALILAHGDRFVVIDGSFYVSEPPQGRFAIGSGYAEAVGHLGDKGPWTKKNVIDAARKARITAQGVGGPIWYVTTVGQTIEKVDE